MASYIGNTCIKNYKNLIILEQITTDNASDLFFWDAEWYSNDTKTVMVMVSI